jgi:serine protease Do
MNHFLRPYQTLGGLGVALLGASAWLAMAPTGARAQSSELVQFIGQEPSPLLGYSSSSQGYLGVDVSDLDQAQAQVLKLKDVHGAMITLIDHDAPAGQIGLKVNDVVLQLNGQNVEGAEQLRRMLKEIPAGRKVSMQISRDGNMQTVTVELADRRVMEHEVWDKIGNGGDVFAQGTGKGILAGGGDEGLPGGFHMPFFGSTLNVGAMVEPLTSQMADYLGVPSGVMVKQVAHKSEAATAGLKAFDVILKVGSDAVTTLADWDRSLRANQGKPVQVTILRDKKQQTLTLQVDSKHKQGELELQELFGADSCPLLAELSPDPESANQFAEQNEAAAQALRDQAEKMRDSMKAEDFKFDQKQLDEMKQQMEEWRKNFKPEDMKNFNFEDFKADPKQMEELRRDMEEFRKDFKPEDFKWDQKQQDELKQQMMDEMKLLRLGTSV